MPARFSTSVYTGNQRVGARNNVPYDRCQREVEAAPTAEAAVAAIRWRDHEWEAGGRSRRNSTHRGPPSPMFRPPRAR